MIDANETDPAETSNPPVRPDSIPAKVNVPVPLDLCRKLAPVPVKFYPTHANAAHRHCLTERCLRCAETWACDG